MSIICVFLNEDLMVHLLNIIERHITVHTIFIKITTFISGLPLQRRLLPFFNKATNALNYFWL